jgi:hypothetical protein
MRYETPHEAHRDRSNKAAGSGGQCGQSCGIDPPAARCIVLMEGMNASGKTPYPGGKGLMAPLVPRPFVWSSSG